MRRRLRKREGEDEGEGEGRKNYISQLPINRPMAALLVVDLLVVYD